MHRFLPPLQQCPAGCGELHLRSNEEGDKQAKETPSRATGCKATYSLRCPSHRWLLCLLLVFLVLANVYSLVTPAWESPDEVGHFSYIAHLLRTHTLPIQRAGELGEAHQPPLYYMLAAVAAVPANSDDPTGTFVPNPRFMWAGLGGTQVNASQHHSAETFPFRGQALALHLARGLSLLLGMFTVALTAAIGWEIFPDRPLIGLLAAALTAFNPQFLFISASVNNDNLLTMAATATWWQTLRATRYSQQRRWAYVAAWVAIAILTKLSGFVIGIVAVLALAAGARHERSARRFVQGAVLLLVTVALVSGWWFVRNQALYGDPVGWSMFHQVFKAVLRSSPLQWNDLGDFFRVQFRSFWGVFGWMNVPAPGWFYATFFILCLLALSGLGLWGLRSLRCLTSLQRTALATLVLAVLMQQSYMLAAITRYDASWYQGRYLFPVIGPLMLIMSLGLTSLLPRRFVALLVAGLLCIAVVVPFRVIQPAYRIVPLSKSSLWLVPNKTEFTFGQQFELKGYRVSGAGGGSEVTVTLYWKALQKPDFDYSVFVHVLDGSGQLIAQKDQAPGESQGYPPTAWWAEDIVADPHVIQLGPQLAHGTYSLRVGMYNWSNGEQLPIRRKGEPVGTFIVLDRTLQL